MKAMKEKVTFMYHGLKVVGELYKPGDFDANKKYAAMALSHPAGGVKEQTEGLYAEKMAELGYIALAFDTTFQGESEGEPRDWEEPAVRIGNLKCALDFLTTLPYVDNDRLALLGICAGGGYVIHAAETEKRVKCVAGVSSVDLGAYTRLGLDGTGKEFPQFIRAIGEQRTREANGGEVAYTGYVPDEMDESLPRDLQEAYKYYRTPRAQHPNSTNRVPLTCFGDIANFTAFDHLDTMIDVPVLMIVGETAITKQFTDYAWSQLNCPDRELLVVKKAGHFDLYDIPEYVDQAVAKLKEFFAKNL